MGSALEVVLELVRGKDAAIDEGYPLGDTEYLLRHGEGAFRSARFPWSQALHQDLRALHRSQPDPQAIQRVGNVLRTFFDGLGWAAVEAEIIEALESKPKREVRVTLRCGAGELCRLPMELLTLQPSGQPLARTEGVHVQWEWPDTASAQEEPPAPPEGGTLLLAWSTAGGGLNSQVQLRAVQRAVESYRVPGTAVVEEPNASLESLQRALEMIRGRKEGVAVLHLLCHGGRLPGAEGGIGLWLDGPKGGVELVDPARFASTLEPYAGLVRCVALCACEGASAGESTNVLGSVAQRLHRVGFPAVVASRLPLSAEGAETFSAAFYAALLAGEPLHKAVAAGRSQLGHEWLALLVYARAVDGGQYPVVFRPYRGLESFEARHRRFFFGRTALTKELLGRVEQAAQGQRPKFQLVAGISGCGKSSLVKAGLVPELPRTWQVVLLRPGGDELESQRGLALLARKLRMAQGAGLEPAPEGDESTVVLEARRLRELRPDRPVLLVVDQLEEALQLPERERKSFLDCLWKLAEDEQFHFVVLGTFRIDILDRAQNVVLEGGRSLESIVYSDSHRLFIPGLSPEDLLEAIERPLEAVGLRFEPDVAKPLRDEAGREPGLLPLLEHALDALWREREGKRLTRAAYERLGLTGALSERLNIVWDALPAEQQRQGQRLLVALVDIADDVSLSTRRRRQLKDLRPAGQEHAELFDAVVERLAAERLVVLGQDADAGSESWVEIAHEALIRRWPRLQEWLREGLADHQLERELEKSARDWVAHKEEKDRGTSYLPSGSRLEAFEELRSRVGPLPMPQQDFITAASTRRHQAKQRTRLAIAVLSIGLLVVSGLGLVTLEQWRVATHEKNKALSRELTALVASRLQSGDPQLNLALLRKASQLARTEQLIPTLAQWEETPSRILLDGDTAHFSPDGLRVVTGHGTTARIWDTASGKLLLELEHFGLQKTITPAPIVSVAFSPRGDRILTWDENSMVRIWDATYGKLLVTLPGHEYMLRTVKFSPDGLRVLIASREGDVRIWDATSGKHLIAFNCHSGSLLTAEFSPDHFHVITDSTKFLHDAEFSPDGLRVVTASDNIARIWHTDSGKFLAALSGHSGHVWTASFSPDGLRIVTSSSDNTARVWDAVSGRLLATLSGHSESVWTASFSPDSLRIVTSSNDNTARIWDAVSDRLLATLPGHSESVWTASFSPDGLRVLTASSDKTARIWDAASGMPLAILSGHSDSVSASFSPDGLRVLTMSRDATTRLWNVVSGKPLAIFSGHFYSVETGAFSPDGLRVVTLGRFDAHVWDATSGKHLTSLSGPDGSLYNLILRKAAFSPDGRRIVITGSRAAHVWDATTGKLIATLSDEHCLIVDTAIFSADGLRIFTISNGSARIWDASSGKLITNFTGQYDLAEPKAFSPDGRRVVTTGHNTAHVWDIASAQVIATLTGHSSRVTTAEFSPDGLRVVTAGDDDTARVWDANSGRLISTLSGRYDGAKTATFSPNGLLILTTGFFTAYVWDATSGALLATLPGQPSSVMTAMFSPDSVHVVTSNFDRAARVWDAKSGKLLATLSGHSDHLRMATFSPDALRVLTVSEDGTARVWRDLIWAPTAVQEALLQSGRELTPEERRIYLHEEPDSADQHAVVSAAP